MRNLKNESSETPEDFLIKYWPPVIGLTKCVSLLLIRFLFWSRTPSKDMHFGPVFTLVLALRGKHAWDTNCFSIVSEAATAYVFYPFKRFKLHYLFILRSYNMRWEWCIILVVFCLLTLNPFWRQRGEVISLGQGDSVGLVVLNCGILNSYSRRLDGKESCLLLMFLCTAASILRPIVPS